MARIPAVPLSTTLTSLKEQMEEDKNVLTKMYIKAPASNLIEVVNSILENYGDEDVAMTIMLQKP